MFNLIISFFVVWQVRAFGFVSFPQSQSVSQETHNDFWGGTYGGNGGGHNEWICSHGNTIRAIAFMRGSVIDAVAFRCTNEAWSPWFGGSGGGYTHYYATGAGFCGFKGKSSWIMEFMCVNDASNGAEFCAGEGNGGTWFHDRTCTQSPGNNRVRLAGFNVRSGRYVDQLQPLWVEMDCDNYISVQQSPDPSWNGVYEFDGWTSGHHRYRKVDDTNKCVFYWYERWRIEYCANIGYHTAKYTIDDFDQYNYCVYNLGGSSHWQHYLGSGWTNIYPALQITGHSTRPLTWGNTVGYWEFLQAGQGAGSISHSIWRSTETTTGHTFTEEEESSFVHTMGESTTAGFEISVGAKAEVGFTAETKYHYAVTQSESTSDGTRNNIITSVSDATMQGTRTTRECTTYTPDTLYKTYVWTVYRASSEENTGASQQTCTFQHQTGACRDVPPNCPIGQCRDENCIWCNSGVDPLTPLNDLRAAHPGCFEEIEEQGLRCPPESRLWSCCTENEQCGVGEGDCDNDSHCQGDLICCNDYGPELDVCCHASGRRLMQQFTTEMMLPTSEPETQQSTSEPEMQQSTSEPETQQSTSEPEMQQSTSEPEIKLDPELLTFKRHSTIELEKISHDDFDEKEHETPHGCVQFDDEAHCNAGPLRQFCQWDDTERFCHVKENVREEDIPDTDFTWMYLPLQFRDRD